MTSQIVQDDELYTRGASHPGFEVSFQDLEIRGLGQDSPCLCASISAFVSWEYCRSYLFSWTLPVPSGDCENKITVISNVCWAILSAGHGPGLFLWYLIVLTTAGVLLPHCIVNETKAQRDRVAEWGFESRHFALRVDSCNQRKARLQVLQIILLLSWPCELLWALMAALCLLLLVSQTLLSQWG